MDIPEPPAWGDERALDIAQSVLPAGFTLELDWSGKTVYCHARKNYIIFNPDGTVYDRKGGAYRSRTATD